MNTGNEHIDNSHLSFEKIDRHVTAFDATSLTPQSSVQSLNDTIQRLNAVYSATRPILLAVQTISLLPAAWRNALSILITTTDDVTASFKAGKDLAIAGRTSQEPKPSVG